MTEPLDSITVSDYVADNAAAWDGFVRASRNGTFLFERSYMDYHSDRFTDASLMFHRCGALVALMPASRHGTELVTHGGLTYGGFVVSDAVTAPMMLRLFAAAMPALAERGIETFTYKTIPSIYHRVPAEEDRYALFRLDATLIRRDVLSVIRRGDGLPFQNRRARGARKARKAGYVAGPSNDLAGFWRVLEARLSRRHDTRPVHNLDEIVQLASRFPNNIRLYTAGCNGQVEAGVLMFDTGRVAHAQYIAADDEALAEGALDLLFDWLIIERYRDHPWFDFGISNERQGQFLNFGLVEYKEGFGARTVVHDFYQLRVDDALQSITAWQEA